MQAIIEIRRKLLEASLKPVTASKYEGQVAQYLRFMGPAPLIGLWTGESAALWIFHCKEVRGLAKSTLKGRIPAFAYGCFKYTGRQCETGKEKRYSVLSMLSRAIDRMADDVRRKIAIRRDDLLSCFPVIGQLYDVSSAIQFWAWWVVSYGAMLRCSETARILWQDVWFSQEQHASGVPKSMSITIRALEESTFKTHSCSVEFKFHSKPGPGICPVRAMWGWMHMCGRIWGGRLPQAVFTMTVEHSRKALQRVAAEALGGTPTDYGLHSLRAGAATDAEEVGWSISEIMFMGRWRSPTVLIYLRQGDRWLQELGLPARTGTTVRPTLFRAAQMTE